MLEKQLADKEQRITELQALLDSEKSKKFSDEIEKQSLENCDVDLSTKRSMSECRSVDRRSADQRSLGDSDGQNTSLYTSSDDFTAYDAIDTLFNALIGCYFLYAILCE